jgi:predicted DNA-binding ribbon-helix-helix protein
MNHVPKRSIVIAGRKTSITLEDAFWIALKEIAGGRNMPLSNLVAAIDSERQHVNLSSAVRVFVLDFYRDQGVWIGKKTGLQNPDIPTR